jgi:hypothetical protein
MLLIYCKTHFLRSEAAAWMPPYLTISTFFVAFLHTIPYISWLQKTEGGALRITRRGFAAVCSSGSCFLEAMRGLYNGCGAAYYGGEEFGPMRPIDHFFSQITRLEAALRPGEGLDAASADRLRRDFCALTAPVIGAAAAEQLFSRAWERLENRHGCRRFGALAAFFLGEFDGASMTLEDDDWEDIRETLEEVSGEINLDTLTALMGELLTRGKV